MTAGRVGRPPICGGCGVCARCELAARKREQWNNLTLEQRRAKIAQRDAARVREHHRRKQLKRRHAGTPEQRLKIRARDHDDYSKPMDVVRAT